MMSAQAKTMEGLAEVPERAAPATGSWMRDYLWSVRRELWEHRAIFVVPAAAAALLIVGWLIGAVELHRMLRDDAHGQVKGLMGIPLGATALVMMGATFLVALFYCLDALNGERRDRSILFWKSLPLPDLTVVLSKMTVPVVVIPAVCFVATLATQAVLLAMGAIFAWTGVVPIGPMNDLPLLQSTAMLLFHLVALHGLWLAPFYAWLLLASAWAKRAAPLLWALLPPVAIAVVEKIAFGTTYFLKLLERRSNANGMGTDFLMKSVVEQGMTQLHAGQFLMSPGLWGGLLVAGVFLACAVQLRRWRGPI